MKKLGISFIILLYSLLYAVNGELTIEDDRMFLRVWGSHAERGEAQGFLLAENIVEMFNEYVINYTFTGNYYFYNQAVTLTEANFQFEEKYLQEMQGIITGLQDSEADIYVPGLNRDLNISDLKLINSLIDISAYFPRNSDFQGVFGCSSFANWGTATQDDPDLNGALVVSRLLDWATHFSLIENSLMVVHEPSETDEQKWISFTYPSLIGALTAVNEAGVYTELNMGNISGTGTDLNNAILLETRSGLELLDYNADSYSNSDDIQDAITAHNHSNGFIIMICDADTQIDPVRYIEVNADGMETRMISDNTELVGNNIASTNHFRKLYNPVYCGRYAALVNATESNSSFTIATNYSTLIDAAGYSGNMMATQYIPSLNIIKWSVYDDHPAYQETLVSYTITDLFEGIFVNTDEEFVPFTENKLTNYPNPFNPKTTISFELDITGAKLTQIIIYNSKGQRVKTLVDKLLDSGNHSYIWDGTDDLNNAVSSGIYFYKLENDNFTKTNKMLLLK